MESARETSLRHFAVVPASAKQREPGATITDPSMGLWLWVPATGSPRRERRGVSRAGTTGREKRRGLCSATLLRLRGPDGGRTATDLDRSGRLEFLAVEVEHHDLFLDHGLSQEGAAVLAPGEALTPVAYRGFGQRDQFVAFDAQHLHQTVVVKERTVFRLVGSVPHVQNDKSAVGRQRDSFRRLTDGDGMNDARGLGLDVNETHRISVAAAGSDIGDDRDLAVRVDGEPVGPQPR